MSSIVERCRESAHAGSRSPRRVGLVCALALFLGMAAAPRALAQLAPPNDNIANAMVLTGTFGSVSGDTTFSTAEFGEPPHYGIARRSVWFAWRAPATSLVVFDTYGSFYDTVLAGYLGTNLAGLFQLASNDDSTFSLDSQITFYAVAGTEYRIAIDGFAGGFGPYVLNWTQGVGTNAPLATNGIQFAATSFSVDEANPGFVTVTVQAGGQFTNTVTVDYYTSDGTGVAGVDYFSVSNTLTFAMGESNKTFTVPVLDNSLQDSNRTVNLWLVNPTGDAVLGAITNATLILLDDETPATVSPAGEFNVVWPGTASRVGTFITPFFFNSNPQYVVTENETYQWAGIINNPDRSVKGALITVKRSGPAVGRVLVDYYATNLFLSNFFGITATQALAVLAQPNVDYLPVSGTLMFDDHQMSANFVVPVLRGFLGSNSVLFNVVLANPRPAPEEDPALVVPTLGPTNWATVEILKVDNPTFGFSIERANYRVDEYRSSSQGTTNVVNDTVDNYIDVNILFPLGGPASVRVSLSSWRFSFPPLPGSDYADPIQVPFDNTPYTDGSTNIINFPDYDNNGGALVTVSFGNNQTVRTLRIPIHRDRFVEFNEDFDVYLWDSPSRDPFGPNDFAHVTILYDDQPAGAADREWNTEGVVYTNPLFYNTPGANHTVSAVGVQPDAKTVIGGDFDHYNSFTRAHVARINFDGSLDTTFNPGIGADGSVNALVLYGTNGPGANALLANKVLIGGGFSSFNGAQRNGIARLNANGSLDTSFAPGNGANGTVRALALQGDGKILVAGDFTTFNDLNVSGIMRLNPDGTLDTTFNPGFAANGAVWSVVVSEAGTNRTIYVAGEFVTFDGMPRNRIARLLDSGALDPEFDPGLGADGSIYAVALQADGKILIGGAFRMYHTFDRGGLARINLDGSLDEVYNVGTGADDSIYTITLQPDGKALIGGVFTSFNTTRRMGLARIFTSGSLDTSFMDSAYNHFAGLPKTFSFDNPSFINAIALQSDGNVMIGGSFTNLGGNLSVNYPTATNSIETDITTVTNVSTNFLSQVVTNVVVYQPNFWESISGRTNRHNSGGHFFGPFTRQDKTTRFNVARLVGGYTPGPGNIEYEPSRVPASIDENSGNLPVQMRRVDGRLGTAQATPATTNTTAVFPLDFTSATSTQIWAEYTATINAVFVSSPRSVGYVGPTYFNIPITDDLLQEGDETFGLIVSNAFGGITLGGEFIPLGTALGRVDNSYAAIADNDFNKGVFSFLISSYLTNEASGYATITVIRANGSSGSADVDYLIRTNAAYSTAAAGVDYTRVNGTLRFGNGETVKTFNVPILNNPDVEQDEIVSLVLTNATGGARLPGGTPTSIDTATLTIVDDDFLPGRLQFSVLNSTNNENDVIAKIDVTRGGGNLGAMTVDFQVQSGLATTPADYGLPTNATFRLTWNHAESSTKSFYVPLVSDGLVEGAESVVLRLVNPSVAGSLGSRTNATLWITDGDAFGILSFSQVSYEGDENGVSPTILVNRSLGSAGTISVDFATTPVIAVPGSDYVSTNGTLVFGPGEFSKIFTVPLIDNGVPDGDRNLLITLSNPINATLGAITNVVLNIVDNESINLAAGSLDTTFSVNAAANAAVYALLQQADGRVLIAGDFTQVSSVPRNRLARLNPGGTLDNTFDIGPGANDSIRGLAFQSNGRMLIGGLFTSVNNTNRGRLARLGTDGSLDLSFNPGAGADSGVFALAVQPNDKVLVGGAFSAFNNLTRPGLVRLNTNGLVDTSFATGAGFNGSVYAIAVQNDGRIVVGGEFTSFNGSARTNILRLNANGTLDTSFSNALYASAPVRAILIEADGRIVIGGSFTNVSGVTRRFLARLEMSGALDPNFLSTPANSGADSTVFAIRQQVDGRFIVAGDFKIFNGVTRNSITRLNQPDGSTDPTINFGSGANGFVSAVVIQPDRRILIGGGFTEYDDQPRQHVARIYGGSISGPGTLEFSAPQFVISEAETNAVVTVRRKGGTTGAASVSFATADGSAVAGRDYLAAAGTLNFPQGETRQVFSVPVLTNTVADGDRALAVWLSEFGGSPGVTNGPQWFTTVLIVDDESTVGFAAPFYAVSESPVNGNATIALIRSGNTNSTVSVGIFTGTNGSATVFLDYLPTNGLVTFLPGEHTRNFNVRILDDANIEPGETLSLSLTNPSGFTGLAISNTVLTINDNEAAAGQFFFATNNFVVDEFAGNAVVVVVRTNGSSGTVTVRLTTGNGTAVSGADYIGTNRMLTFAQGDTVMSLAFPILNDGTAEPDETINLTLSSPTGGSSILTSNAIATIADDEIVPSYVGYLTNNFFVSEGAGFASVTVVRTNSRRGDVAIDFTLSNGSATAGLDHVITNGTLVFTNNEVAKDFIVPILEDILGEGDETIRLSLGNLRATNTTAFLSVPTSTLTIQDNDTSVHFSTAEFSAAPESSSNAVITVLRTGTSNDAVSATFLTRPGGTAVDGLDYLSVTSFLAWAAGDLSPKTVLVPLIDNTGINPARTVLLALTNILGTSAYLEAPSDAVLTISDDEFVNPLAGTVDPTFNIGIGANGAVQAVAYDSQQRLVVGGEFTRFHGFNVKRVARLTTNGAVDVRFNVGTGADNTVLAVAPVADTVYVGGTFTNFGGVPRARLARLLDDGSVDPAFVTGAGANGAVRAVALSGQQVVVAGDFTLYNNQAATRLARLNANGTLDGSFNVAVGANRAVRALAVQADGKVIVGGDFSTLNGYTAPGLARLNANGTFDTTFAVGLGADSNVWSIVLQPDGKVLVGGQFLTFNGAPRARVVRLNTDGAVDLSFNPGSGLNGDVRSLALQSDGRVVVVGAFTVAAGNPSGRLARLNADGSLDSTFAIGTGANSNVNSVATFTILPPPTCVPPVPAFVTFDFTGLTNGQVVSNYTENCLNFGGTNGMVFHVVSNNFGLAAQLLVADGSLMQLDLGGRPFTLASINFAALQGTVIVQSSSGGTVVIPAAGFWNFDSTFADVTWVQISVLTGNVTLDNILVIPPVVPVALPTDLTALGGEFTRVNEQLRGRVAVLDSTGAVSSQFDPAAIPTHTVYALDVHTNLTQPSLVGKVLVGGDFTALVGVEGINRVGRLNIDGTLDATFNAGVGANDAVRAVAVQPDGKAILGGLFTTYDFLSRAYLARVNADGTLDNTFNIGAGLDNAVLALALQPDGRTLVGGDFTTIYGAPRAFIGRVNANGTVDTNFLSSADGPVHAIALQSNGRVVIGGDFTLVNGVPRSRIARLNSDGSLDLGFNPGSGFANGTVHAVAITAGGEVLAGGTFTHFNGNASPRLAKLTAGGAFDSSFAIGSGADDFVSSIRVQPDGKILVGGNFIVFNGQVRNRLVRLNNDGTFDPAVNFGMAANGFISAIGLQGYDSKILVGGGFTEFGGQPRVGIARILGGDNSGAGAIQFAAAAYSVNEASNGVTVAVVRAGGTFGAASVNFNTVNGGASSPGHYTATSGTLNFAQAETVKYITIPIIDNAATNVDRVFGVTLSGAVNATLGSPAVTAVAILDNDSQLSFSTAAYSVNENSGVARITVTRSGGAAARVTVDAATGTNGTATAGLDYIPRLVTLIFDPGVRALTFDVPVSDDVLNEFNETVPLALFNATGPATPGVTNATLTIVENDFAAGVLGFSTNNYFVSEDGGSVLISVVRTNGHSGAVTVAFATTFGTASNGLDYAVTNGVLTFANGVTNALFSVRLLDDALLEGNETVALTLESPGGGATIGGSAATLTIVENDRPGDFMFSEPVYTANENGGSTVITVLRTNGNVGALSVSFATSAGTAAAGLDFTGVSGVLNFAPGQTFTNIALPILDDDRLEGTEVLTVLLSGNTNIITPAATVQIIDNEVGVSFAQAGYFVTEGITNAFITLVRNGDTNRLVSVRVNTADITASAGFDYLALPPTYTVTFAPGETNATFLIAILNDTVAEGDETLNITLSNPSASPAGLVTLGPVASTTLTVLDDDISFSFSAAVYTTNEGAVGITIPVLRSGSLVPAVAVDFATSDGTAAAGFDYGAVATRLSFASGVSVVNVPVAIIDDLFFPQVEGNETVNLTLANPSVGAFLGVQSVAIINITDNDTLIGFSKTNFIVNEKVTNAIITVVRTGNATNTASIRFRTANGTAGAADYTSVTTVLNWGAGDVTPKTVPVPVTDDGVIEGAETVALILENPTNAVIDPVFGSGVALTIVDNAGAIAFSSATYNAVESDGSAIVNLVRTGGTNGTVSVDWIATGGTAVNGQDFTGAFGTVVFANGETQKPIIIPVTDDALVEGLETISLALTNAAGGARSGSPATSLLRLFDSDAGLIVGSGSALAAESNVPANNVIESNEVVTLLFALRNNGLVNDSVTATLVYADGVTATNAAATNRQQQSYGTLLTGGNSTSRPFTFRAVGTNGARITATLLITNGAGVFLGDVAFSYILGPQQVPFANASPITLSSIIGTAAPYPSTLAVSGVSGPVNGLTVTLFNMTHAFPDDLDILLVGPQGQSVMLMSDAGGGNPTALNNATLTFDAAAAAFIPDATQITSGTYKPANYLTQTDPFPAPAPQIAPAPWNTNLAVFNSTSPNGVWSLYVVDDSTGADIGSIAGGWSINIRTADPVLPGADLSVVVTDSPDPVLVNGTITYTVSVTNHGPASAAAVAVTNLLPAGVSLVSATTDATNISAGTVVLRFGTLAVGAGSSGTIVVTAPITAGDLTFDATVGSATVDLNLVNNQTAPKTTVMDTNVVAPPPVLFSALKNNSVVLTWIAASNVALQTKPLLGGASWSPATNPVATSNGVSSATVPVTGGSSSFFRLRKNP